MLSSGTKAVPSPACLRCQLRSVLHHHLRLSPATLPRPSPFAACRPFSTTYSRHAADADNPATTPRQYSDWHLASSGRIVGKRGRKQRQTSEALATDSLGEKSEIVVFRDVPQHRKKPTERKEESNYVDLGEQSLKGLSLTPEQIEAALSGSGQTPDEEEVTKSIEALRPQAPVIEDAEFDRLVKELLDSYNLKQLSRYLSQSLKSHHTSTTVVRELEYKRPASGSRNVKTISFTRSRWQPGRTPLDVRRISAFPEPSQLRGRKLGPKARAADRILRVAWQITKKIDEQKVGELEVQIPPWALAMFFDLATDGVPSYHKLIEPAILLRRSEIRPYRLDNIIRITARRQDADEIATQLENKVLLIGKQVLHKTNELIGTSRGTYPNGQSLQYFSQHGLDEISRWTQSIFMQQADGGIGIYSFRKADRSNARRLLLGLLDPQSRNDTRTILGPSIQPSAKAEPPSLALVPVFADRGLHLRDRSKAFARAVLPIQRATPPTISTKRSHYKEAEGISRRILSLVKDFDPQRVEEPAAVGKRSSDPSIFWAGRTFKASPTWSVHLGLLLQESTSDKSGSLLQDKHLHHGTQGSIKGSSKQLPVFLRQVPGYETLLSYFEPIARPRNQPVDGVDRNSQAPSDRVIRKSTIVAHFMPNPFFSTYGVKALDLFPKLELTIIRRSFYGPEEGQLKIDGLRAITGEHHIDIPLPDRVVDLRLTRKIGAYASMPAVLANPQIQQFVAALNQSINSKGPLQGTTDVTFKLPGWMGETDSAVRKAQDDSRPEIEVPYLFERFEQVQSTTFKKDVNVLGARAEHNASVHAFHDSFPTNLRPQYSEIEAGIIGGRQTDVSFSVHLPKDVGAQAGGSEELEVHPSNSVLSMRESPRDEGTLKHRLVPALAVADFVTRACKNEVTTWRGQYGSERSDPASLRSTDSEVVDGEEANVEEMNAEEANVEETSVEEDEHGETREETRSDDESH